MKDDRTTRISKFLSMVLRHQPEKIGIELDGAGWVDVDVLLQATAKYGKLISLTELEHVVSTNAKQRFAFSDDRRRIRASQGHSVEVDLRYEAAEPPDELYHGTASRSIASIREKGLIPGQRHDVHLSERWMTAREVGARYGSPVVLVIRAREMHTAGHRFCRSTNGVWLTQAVPPEFIEFPAGVAER